MTDDLEGFDLLMCPQCGRVAKLNDEQSKTLCLKCGVIVSRASARVIHGLRRGRKSLRAVEGGSDA